MEETLLRRSFACFLLCEPDAPDMHCCYRPLCSSGEEGRGRSQDEPQPGTAQAAGEAHASAAKCALSLSMSRIWSCSHCVCDCAPASGVVAMLCVLFAELTMTKPEDEDPDALSQYGALAGMLCGPCYRA